MEVPLLSWQRQRQNPVWQGLISMTSVFFTTIIICTMTGIVVIASGLLETPVDGVLLDEENCQMRHLTRDCPAIWAGIW